MSTIHSFTIANHEHVVNRVNELRHRADDIKSKVGHVLKHLWNTERELGAIKNLSIFGDLRKRFPNFTEAIEFFEGNAIALNQLDMPYEANPVLLIGDPGLGKTLFVSELAKLMGLPFFEISMNTASASFALTGGNLQWGDASVGFIAKSLSESSIANPIIMIDEIDKGSGNSGFNPMNSFYGLLEPHSAKRFKDEALEVEIDASKIIWVLTGNYIGNIPEAILSRMRVINISQPTKSDMPDVIKSIYTKIRTDKVFGKVINPDLDAEVINILTDLPPRQIRMTLEAAVLRAIMDRRSMIHVADIKYDKKEKRHAIGFF
ncbi:MAG: AAA family ATPase [Methylotenera sp.]|uniref:AAA family ATPase n=1 Tax=Methylotenera sp. TaxID=2051956 RepID=UPI002486E5B2|nr:AAA family ATPase [Methylotenera sp.]MDI1310450.1 AAA family ATPase [Methylotenera sp.]